MPRRALRDVAVPRFAYVRVHVHPIRYPTAYTTDWRVRSAELLPDAHAASLHLRNMRS